MKTPPPRAASQQRNSPQHGGDIALLCAAPAWLAARGERASDLFCLAPLFLLPRG